MKNKIPGGFILKARCIQQSDISHATPCTREVWDWLLINASHTDTQSIKRGQLFIRYKEIIEGLSWKVGFRKMSYTNKQLATAMKTLRRMGMIVTTKVVMGVHITVCNYSKFQDMRSYVGSNVGGSVGGKNHYKEEKKKEKNIPDSIESGSFYLTKKKRKLTNKRLETFNVFWSKFNFKYGKADAADSWFDIPVLTDTLVNQIYKSADNEAKLRDDKIANGQTPKWAQGWLTSRRWEDEIPQDVTIIHNQPTAEDLINA